MWILIIHIPFHDMMFDEITGNHEVYTSPISCEIAKVARVGYYQELDRQNHTNVAQLAAQQLECVSFEVRQ